MKLVNKVLLMTIMCFVPTAASAQRKDIKIPAELKPFIENGMKAIEWKKADLNNDGKMDFVLVLGSAKVKSDEVQNDDSQRPLLIITPDAAGKLSVAARNDLAVFCGGCGGVMGDPFQGVEVKKSTFTVINSGGSREKWSNTFQFSYSNRDKTWQLVRVVESSHDSLGQEKDTKDIFTPPKSFGKINFADFNPDDFKGKGGK